MIIQKERKMRGGAKSEKSIHIGWGVEALII
jgi:hypothetical protein